MSFTGERYVPQLRGQIYYEHLHRYALALTLARDLDVLDIASGEGYGAAFLAMVARSVVGVDIDAASVGYSSARYTAMNLSFLEGSAVQIPLADESVDLVVSFETIEHLSEHERMLGELDRVLRPNGRVIISSPNKLVYSDARDSRNPFHVRELYFAEFRDQLRAVFPVVRIFGQRLFAGSAVHPLGGTAPDCRWLGPSLESGGGPAALADPEYFIAICGCRAGDELPNLASVFLDPRDDLLADIRAAGVAVQAPRFELIPGSPAPLAEAGFSDVLDGAVQSSQCVSAADATLRGVLQASEGDPLPPRDVSQTALRVNSEVELVRESYERDVEELTEACRRASVEIERLHDQFLAERSAHANAQAELSILRTALRVAADDRAQAERELSQTQERLIAVEALLGSVMTSASWRVTEPIRKAASRVRLMSARSK